MPRVARVVIADVAHHVTQRGNGRQYILASDGERLVYLDLLRWAVRGHELSVFGGSSWRREKRPRSCALCGGVRTRADRWGRKSSRGRWKNVPSAG